MLNDAELDAALERMSAPLSESRLSGITAQEDTRCMGVIRTAIAALRAENARQAERIAQLEQQVKILSDPDDEPTAGDYECTR